MQAIRNQSLFITFIKLQTICLELKIIFKAISQFPQFSLNALFTKTCFQCRGRNPAFFLNEISTLHLYFPLLPKYKCTLSPLGFVIIIPIVEFPNQMYKINMPLSPGACISIVPFLQSASFFKYTFLFFFQKIMSLFYMVSI